MSAHENTSMTALERLHKLNPFKIFSKAVKLVSLPIVIWGLAAVGWLVPPDVSASYVWLFVVVLVLAAPVQYWLVYRHDRSRMNSPAAQRFLKRNWRAFLVPIALAVSFGIVILSYLPRILWTAVVGSKVTGEPGIMAGSPVLQLVLNLVMFAMTVAAMVLFFELVRGTYFMKHSRARDFILKDGVPRERPTTRLYVYAAVIPFLLVFVMGLSVAHNAGL